MPGNRSSITVIIDNNCLTYQELAFYKELGNVKIKYKDKEVTADVEELKVVRVFKDILIDLGFSRDEAGKIVFQLNMSNDFTKWLVESSKQLFSYCIKPGEGFYRKELINQNI